MAIEANRCPGNKARSTKEEEEEEEEKQKEKEKVVIVAERREAGRKEEEEEGCPSACMMATFGFKGITPRALDEGS